MREAIYVVVGFFLLMGSMALGMFGEEDKRKRYAKEGRKELDQELTKVVAENLDMEKKLADMQQDYAKQQDMAEEICRIQEQIRALKHDMKNHTMVLLSYLEENRVEEAKAYAGELLDELNKMYTYVNVGNSLLNYIINNKLSMAKE